MTFPNEPGDVALLRQQAWIGDAVLALYARSWIIGHAPVGVDRTDLFKRMTCNHFLSAFGEPTKVEAHIGRLYEGDGLEPAFRYIETELVPLFEKQNRSTSRR